MLMEYRVNGNCVNSEKTGASAQHDELPYRDTSLCS